MEVSELIRMLLQQIEELSLDVSKAFDSIEHPLLDKALAGRQVPVCLRAATHLSVSMEVNMQGTVTPPIPLEPRRKTRELRYSRLVELLARLCPRPCHP
eukprot:8294354-Heterocapsa_arctica.AAC.1